MRTAAGLAIAALGLALGYCTAATAAYGTVPKSTVDPEVVRIDETRFLGVSVARDYALVGADGAEFTLGELLGKPLILVLSYYTCDGACSVVNRTLANTLQGVDDWRLGRDYRVLTVSFDSQDGPDGIAAFVEHAGFKDGLPEGWTAATFKHPADIQRLTGSLGYKFFWEPRDRVFLHPSVYVVLSPEGRATRFLYAASVNAEDIEFSITKAYGNELAASKFVNFVVGACYSYNYKDGKYTVNYPVFIAVGALGIGLTSLLGGSIILKRRVRK